MATYVGQSAVQALTTSAAVPYPTGKATGDIMLLHANNTATGINNAPAGWTEVGTLYTAGGMSSRTWWRVVDGSETGTIAVSVTSGVKGNAWTTAYRPAAGNTIAVNTNTQGADTTSTTTAFSAAGSSWTTTAGDMIVGHCNVLAVGTFSGNMTSLAFSQTSQTGTYTGRFGALASTSTIYLAHFDVSVTTGSTNAPTFSGTTVGSNGTGQVKYVLLRETLALIPPEVVMAPIRRS